MTLTPWLHDNPFVPGSTVRADAVNFKMDGIAEAINAICNQVNNKLPNLPSTFAGNAQIPEKSVANTLLYINSVGDMDLYSKVLFDQDVEDTANNKTASEEAAALAGQHKDDAELAQGSAEDAALLAGQHKDGAQTARAEAEEAASESQYWASVAQSATGILDIERRAVERASGGRQTVIYDNSGNPSVMCVVPVFRYEDLGLTAALGSGVVSAFDTGTGAHKSEIFIGAFQSSLIAGKACSILGVDPTVSISFDNARAACIAKGAGWHLMTIHEWAAIALWCQVNGFIPRGNTYFGRAHDRAIEVGRRQDGALPGGIPLGNARIKTGSGPAAWRHDNAMTGIADLVGNVKEFQDGVSVVNGQIKASTFNTQQEPEWSLQAAFLDGNVSAVLSHEKTVSNTVNMLWSSLTKSGGYVTNQLLKRLLIEPSGVSLPGLAEINSYAGEYMINRGGDFSQGVDAGFGNLAVQSDRYFTSPKIGFRLAFVS